MSYILDALRRAQAERERGQIPGLNSQESLVGRPPLATGADNAVGRGKPGWLWALGGAVLALGLALPWWLPRAGAPPAVAPAAVAPPPPVAAEASPVPAVVPAAAPAAVGLVVVSAPSKPSAGPAQAARTAADGPRPSGASVSPVTRPMASPSAGPTGTADAPAAADAGSAVPAPAASPPVASPSTMPPTLTAEQRREWPPLSVNGSVWSDTPSARFVILGGQLVYEGQSTPEGVVVERITPKAVVLRWKDQRASLGL